MSSYEEKLQEAKDTLNQKLKELKTYEDLQSFFKEMNENPYGLTLRGKRRGYYAFSFSHMYEHTNPDGSPSIFTNIPYYKDRVHYLYSDGASVGESYVKNLYRVFRVDD